MYAYTICNNVPKFFSAIMSVRISMTLFNSFTVAAWYQYIYMYECISSQRIIENTLLVQSFAVIFEIPVKLLLIVAP